MKPRKDQTRPGEPPEQETLLIADGSCAAVEFSETHLEAFIVGAGLILKDTYGEGLAQDHGYIRVAAIVNSRQDSVAEGGIGSHLGYEPGN